MQGRETPLKCEFKNKEVRKLLPEATRAIQIVLLKPILDAMRDYNRRRKENYAPDVQRLYIPSETRRKLDDLITLNSTVLDRYHTDLLRA